MKIRDLEHIVCNREKITIINELDGFCYFSGMFVRVLKIYGDVEIKKMSGYAERTILIQI